MFFISQQCSTLVRVYDNLFSMQFKALKVAFVDLANHRLYLILQTVILLNHSTVLPRLAQGIRTLKEVFLCVYVYGIPKKLGH